MRGSVTLDTCIMSFPTKGFRFGLSCLIVSLLKKEWLNESEMLWKGGEVMIIQQ